jgi:hypothetical protein
MTHDFQLIESRLLEVHSRFASTSESLVGIERHYISLILQIRHLRLFTFLDFSRRVEQPRPNSDVVYLLLIIHDLDDFRCTKVINTSAARFFYRGLFLYSALLTFRLQFTLTSIFLQNSRKQLFSISEILLTKEPMNLIITANRMSSALF